MRDYIETGHKSQRLRTIIIISIIELFFAFLIYRLFFLQYLHSDELRVKAEAQYEKSVSLQAKRGNIYDAKLNPLAINVKTYSLFCDPSCIEQKDFLASSLAEILKIPENYILQKLDTNKRFVWIKRQLPESIADRIKSLNIKGLGFEEEGKRFYPKGSLAANVIGFVGLDNIGLEGIEREYDRYMHGSLKIVTTQKDRKGRNLNPMDLDYNYTTRGNDVVLTIDEVLQNIAEKELETACLKWESNGGSVIIMEPKTGKILAVANYPTYDLNNAFSADSDYMRNRAFIDLYEPGSAFKIITASALINENLVNTNDSIYCENGFYNINGRIVHDSEGYGSLTFGEVLEKSSNIGMVKFASRLSGEKFYEYIKAFGLNEKTGAGIPETIGFIKSIADWTGYSMGTIPYGHEISVTAIQMLSAVNAIANDGIIMKPYIIQSIMSGDSSIMESKPTQFKNPISKRTASIMRDLLTMAVKNGTGRNAQVEGYSVAGKTGTSQKSAGYGKGYMPGKYVSSFVGLLPVENPLISMIVIIDEPKGSYYGGTVACPVFKNIAEQSMQYLKISQGVKLVANY